MQNIDHAHFDEIYSTHLYARANINQLKPNRWSLCTANSQVAGIGTKNSKWVSPRDLNIYASYSFLTAKENAEKTYCIPQLACLQIVRILESCGIDSKIKWVNDVLVNGRKISGVLCESIAGVRGEDIAVIVSIGLNVNASLLDLSGLEGIATSMKMESNKQYDLQQLIMQLSSSLLESVNHLFASGFSQFRPEISQKLERFDSRVVTLRSLSGSSMRGVIKDIGDSGELIVETERGVVACFEGSILI